MRMMLMRRMRMMGMKMGMMTRMRMMRMKMRKTSNEEDRKIV